MQTNILRKTFLEYFKGKEHTVVPSSSLVPGTDPTLLFVNAGMVPFKEVFLGTEKRSYTRATSSQRCLRVSGKHNDLEQVGYTARHHTFFEMLGNFSFGDYFKREAIQYAWEFLTEILHIDPKKLWVTVYQDDDEAADIWLKEIRVDPARFSRCGEKDNFWSMGETGPCGPCSEIFYDHGADIAGGPPGSAEQEGDRYTEIWNLVFMQYNRNAEGNLKPLPKPSVDTGMGLERIAAVMQGVHSNYDIDVFRHLIQRMATLAHCKDLANPCLRVIADHIRAAAFLVVDGIVPSNEGRGYVLRRIIRRALGHGHKLDMQEPFFYKLVEPLVEIMGQAYPELVQSQRHIEHVIQQEEVQFSKTLAQGFKILEQAVAELKGSEIPGAVVFKLYDTYGFPADLTAAIAKERNLTIDMVGFEQAMSAQRTQSQVASKFEMTYDPAVVSAHATQFTGYESHVGAGKIVALLQDGKSVDGLQAGEQGVVLLDRTPFYAESGGQVGDTGELQGVDGLFVVEDTQKAGDAYMHIGKVTAGAFSVGDKVDAQINIPDRQATALNHSVTHLLHAALKTVLGEHAEQKGSSVDPYHLRFDFVHFQPVTAAELQAVEQLVNQYVRANVVVETQVMTPEEAKSAGAIALFGEKYGEKVRVVSMGAISKELCGGTHTQQTGDIGLFRITSEAGVAAGVRRIEAVTGEVALRAMQQKDAELQAIREVLKAGSANLVSKLEQLLSEKRVLEKTLSVEQAKLAQGKTQDLLQHVETVGDVHVLAVQVQGVEQKVLRDMLDAFKDKLQKAVIVLALITPENRIHLVAGVTKNCTKTLHAGELVKMVAAKIGGKGGGRPDMAQGGGMDVVALPEALQSVAAWVKEHEL